MRSKFQFYLFIVIAGRQVGYMAIGPPYNEWSPLLMNIKAVLWVTLISRPDHIASGPKYTALIFLHACPISISTEFEIILKHY